MYQGIGTRESDLTGFSGTFITGFKLSTGFIGDRWYGAGTTAYHHGTARLSEKPSLSTN